MISIAVAIQSRTTITIDRTDEAYYIGPSKLRLLIFIMLAIIRGGAWECKKAREPFQNNHFLSFSLGTEILKIVIKENTYKGINLPSRWATGYIAKRKSHKVRNIKVEPRFNINIFDKRPFSSKNSLSPRSSSII